MNKTDLQHVFVASDCHFGSHALPSFLAAFTEEQEKELVKNWNSVVGKDDIVYYNGDFCDGNVAELCDYFRQLNGQITLIKGNHDKFDDDIYRAVFKDVVEQVVMPELDLTIHHCPGPVSTKFEIFGHLHRDGMLACSKFLNGHSFCSCVQHNNGCPVSLEKVMKSFRLQTCQEDC